MSFTDEIVRTKLSVLQDTQESIVSLAQWILFHRRFAERTAQLWSERLADSNPVKRLNLIYLVNEIVQQSKAKRREEFLNAFTPIIVDSITTAYKGAPIEVQAKIRRVADVWRQRSIFEGTIQEAVEASIDGIEKTRPTTHRKPLGGALFSSDANAKAPAALVPLIQAQQAIERSQVNNVSLAQKADEDYADLTDGALPSPPVLAARLHSLAKAFASVDGSLAESIKQHESVRDALEQLLASNGTALAEEKRKRNALRLKREAIEKRRASVEDAIMRGLEITGTDVYGGPSDMLDIEPQRPDVERFTPPPEEGQEPGSTTPADSPPAQPPVPSLSPNAPASEATNFQSQTPGQFNQSPPVIAEPPISPPPPSTTTTQIPESPGPSGVPLNATLDPRKSLDPRRRNASKSPGNVNTAVTGAGAGTGSRASNSPTQYQQPPIKKRKTSDADYLAGFEGGDALEGLDAEVVGMLG